MKINPILYGVVVLVLFLGVIVAFQSAGVWSVSGKVDAGGGRIEPSAADTSTIKGWMTLQQVSEAYDVPLEEILAEFGLPSDTPPATALKELESNTFDLPQFRTWLQARQP